MGYSPGGAPGRVREEERREGGLEGGRKARPVRSRLPHVSQLGSSQGPSTPGTQLIDTRGTDRPGRRPEFAMATRPQPLSTQRVFVRFLILHRTRYNVGSAWVRSKRISAGKVGPMLSSTFSLIPTNSQCCPSYLSSPISTQPLHPALHVKSRASIPAMGYLETRTPKPPPPLRRHIT